MVLTSVGQYTILSRNVRFCFFQAQNGSVMKFEDEDANKGAMSEEPIKLTATDSAFILA